jgi:hypothetical protein
MQFLAIAHARKQILSATTVITSSTTNGALNRALKWAADNQMTITRVDFYLESFDGIWSIPTRSFIRTGEKTWIQAGPEE